MSARNNEEVFIESLERRLSRTDDNLSITYRPVRETGTNTIEVFVNGYLYLVIENCTEHEIDFKEMVYWIEETFDDWDPYIGSPNVFNIVDCHFQIPAMV